MKKNERMALICGEVIDLKDAVDAYMKVQMSSGCRYPAPGYDNLPRRCSRQAIKRRIVQIRQNLLTLADEMDGGADT